jgi:hypothetical protein
VGWWSGIQIPTGGSDFYFSRMIITQSPIQWVLGLFPGGKAAVASH